MTARIRRSLNGQQEAAQLSLLAATFSDARGLRFVGPKYHATAFQMRTPSTRPVSCRASHRFSANPSARWANHHVGEAALQRA